MQALSWIRHRAAESYSIALPLWLWVILASAIAVFVSLWRRRRRKQSTVRQSPPLVVGPSPGRPVMPEIELNAASIAKPSALSQPLDRPDTHSWLRESSPDEIHNALSTNPPLRREAVAKELFYGRWVRWEGKVVGAKESSSGGYVQLTINGGGTAFLNFTKNEVHVIENLREGDPLRFEAEIGTMLGLSIDLYKPRLLPT